MCEEGVCTGWSSVEPQEPGSSRGPWVAARPQPATARRSQLHLTRAAAWAQLGAERCLIAFPEPLHQAETLDLCRWTLGWDVCVMPRVCVSLGHPPSAKWMCTCTYHQAVGEIFEITA